METIVPLLKIIRRLRGENGCEWDQKQTPLTMWKCLAEELYELEEAIVNEDLDNTIEEIGDVLFQVLFILEIFTDYKHFAFSQVVDRVAEKMIRRHPHVYDTAKIHGKDALNRQWEKIKAEEKSEAGIPPSESVLDGVPKGMPGLLRALKVSKSAVKAGFEWDDIHQVLDTVRSEIKEFETALEAGDKNEAMMEFGDIVFSLVNVARFAGFHPESALYRSTTKFEGRFRMMEAALKKERLDLKKMRAGEKQAHWQAAKQAYADGYPLA